MDIIFSEKKDANQTLGSFSSLISPFSLFGQWQFCKWLSMQTFIPLSRYFSSCQPTNISMEITVGYVRFNPNIIVPGLKVGVLLHTIFETPSKNSYFFGLWLKLVKNWTRNPTYTFQHLVCFVKVLNVLNWREGGSSRMGSAFKDLFVNKAVLGGTRLYWEVLDCTGR